MYQYALDQIQVEPESVVYVGDGGDDELAGAKAFGMTTVWLKRPDHRPRELESDYIIHSLNELSNLPVF